MCVRVSEVVLRFTDALLVLFFSCYLPFWSWMYCLTVLRLTVPTVLMNADFVHMFGSRVTRSGYSCLMMREEPPLSFLTQFMMPKRGLHSMSR